MFLRHFTFLLGFFLLNACAKKDNQERHLNTPIQEASLPKLESKSISESMNTMENQINRLYKDVKFLTEVRPFRNVHHPESLLKVAAYIKEEFRRLGFEVSEQRWKVKGKEYVNIIATYNKKEGERLIVGAHYDVHEDQPGADDNASAVAGLLEVARMLSQQKPKLEYQIDFVAYSLEEEFNEPEVMGSYVHAKSLHEKKVKLKGMICLEMIGYFSDEPNSQQFPDPTLASLYPTTANFILVVGVEKYRTFNEKIYSLMKKDSTTEVHVIHFPNMGGVASLSDHINFWRFGYQALMINDTSFFRNPNYHKATDTIETLNFEKMAGVVNGLYHAMINL